MSAGSADAEQRPIPRGGLRSRIAIVVITISLAPMLLVSGVTLFQFDSFANEMVHAHLEELVLKHRQNIDDFLRERLNDIGYLARIDAPDQLQDSEFLWQRLRTLQEAYGFAFVDLGLIDESGLQVSYAGPFELQGADYRDSEWFQEAIQRDSYMSDVFLGLRETPHFIVAVKLSSDEKEWILRATIDFAAFNTLVEGLTLGRTGSAFIMNRQGAFQTRPPGGDSRLDQEQYLNLFQSREETAARRARCRTHPPTWRVS